MKIPFLHKKNKNTSELPQRESQDREEGQNPAGEQPYLQTEEYRSQIRGLLIKRRALKKATRRVLLSKKTTLLLALLLLFLIGTGTAAYVQERMGNFTINLNRIDMYKQGISLSDNSEFSDPQSRLTAESVKNATNITLSDLPKNIDDIDGNHNGENYMAYTFYIKNGGKEPIDYYASIAVESQSKGVDKAVRVVVYSSEQERRVFAKRARNGEPEPDTTPFVADDMVMNDLIKDFKVGDVNKYCVVIFLEGNDPECVDDIIGGMVRLRMDFNVKDPVKDR